MAWRGCPSTFPGVALMARSMRLTIRKLAALPPNGRGVLKMASPLLAAAALGLGAAPVSRLEAPAMGRSNRVVNTATAASLRMEHPVDG